MPELPADGVGVSESQLDWTPWSVTEDVALDGTCSKRKRAFLAMALPRLLSFIEKNALNAHPKSAPWHITSGVCSREEISTYVMELNWSGWWFRHVCRAADILKIPCPNQGFTAEDQPWDRWGQAIELKLEHLNEQLDSNGEPTISRDWERPPLFMGNRFPRVEQMMSRDLDRIPFFMGNRFPAKDGNLCECRIPLPPESIALAQLAEQASKCQQVDDLEIPAELRKFF